MECAYFSHEVYSHQYKELNFPKAHEFSEEAPCYSSLVLISCLLHIKSGTFPSKYNYIRAPPQRFWFNWCGWGLGHLLNGSKWFWRAARVRNNSREEPRIGRHGPRGEVQLESLSQLCKQQQQSRLWSQNGNQIPCLSLASWSVWDYWFQFTKPRFPLL